MKSSRLSPSRSVLPIDTLAHTFASGGVVPGLAGGDSDRAAYRSAKAAGGISCHIEFSGQTDAGPVAGTVGQFYSYSTAVAGVYFVGPKKGPVVPFFVVSSDSHSPTTARHLSVVRRALPGAAVRIPTDRGRSLPDSPAGLLKDLVYLAEKQLLKAGEAQARKILPGGLNAPAPTRRKLDRLTGEALALGQTYSDAAKNLAALAGLKAPALPDLSEGSDLVARAAARAQAAAVTRRRRELETAAGRAAYWHYYAQSIDDTATRYCAAVADLTPTPAEIKSVWAKVKRTAAAAEKPFTVTAPTWADFLAEITAAGEQAEKDWRTWGSDYAPGRVDGRAILRARLNNANGLEIETSQGVRLTLTYAQTCPVINRLDSLRRNPAGGDSFHIGPYAIRRADADGVQIGCHSLPWSELEVLRALIPGGGKGADLSLPSSYSLRNPA